MNTKLVVLLGSVGAVHLAAGVLFLAGGCMQEDPPMPPGIYVPKQSSHDAAAVPPASAEPAAAQAEPAGQAELSTTAPAEPAPGTAYSDPAPKAAPEAKSESRGEKVYIVVKNDSLWLIARKNGLTIEELASYNSLSPKAKLRIGQKLYIPPTGKKGVRNAAPRAKAKGKASPAKKGKKARAAKASSKLPPDGIYTVKEHDNFSIIAKRFGIKVSDIIAANPGVDSSRLKIGQKLRLTAGAAAIPKAKAASRKKAKAAKPAGSAAPAAASADAANPAEPAAAAPAPTTEKKADAAPDDPETLLNTVKQPQDNAAPETNKAPAAPQTSSFSQDKDRMIKGENGRLTVVLGEDINLAKFCKKFTVSEQVIRSQNNIPADGRLKAGTSILLIPEDNLI